jgi:signal transduction histidine kinase
VFLSIIENVLQHGQKVTRLKIDHQENRDGLVLTFEDDGGGIASDMKDLIFERRFSNQKGMSLFLVREILSITGITIQETGIFGEGARFEIIVPKVAYRLVPAKYDPL